MGNVRISLAFVMTSWVLLAGTPLLAGSHSWAPWEFYSNSDGTIQYVVLWNPTAPAENSIQARDIRTDAHISDDYGSVLPGNTADRYLLAATAAFAALPGAPTPDFPLVVDDFFDTGGDTVTFWTYGFAWSSFSFGPGELPDGAGAALRRDGYTATTGSTVRGLPLTYDGATFAPAHVSSSLTVEKVTPDGSRLFLEWDDSGCLGTPNHQIIYGFGSDLPASPGGSYGLQAGNPLVQCSASSPKLWQGVPDPAVDATNLLWFLVLANDTLGTEGSWGKDGFGGERDGAGPGGVSAQCGNTAKSLVNSCGQ